MSATAALGEEGKREMAASEPDGFVPLSLPVPG